MNIFNLTWKDVTRLGIDSDGLHIKSGEYIRRSEYALGGAEWSHLKAVQAEYELYGLKTHKEPPKRHGTDKPLYYNGLEFLSQPDEDIPFLVENLIPKSEFFGMVGKGGSNKSTYFRQLSLCIALKKPTFLGLKLNVTHGRALYCYSEDGDNWLRRYIRSNCRGLGVTDRDSLLQNLILVPMHNFDTGKSLLDWFQPYVAKNKFDLVVLDSFSDLLTKFSAKMNDNDEVRAVINSFQFAKANDCAVGFNHHIGEKQTTTGTTLGASSFRQAIRCLLEITKDSGNRRVLSHSKGQYSAELQPIVLELTQDFILQNTGETVTREELSDIAVGTIVSTPRRVGKPVLIPVDVDTVKKVFGADTKLATVAIKRELLKHYTVSDRTMEFWISDVLTRKYIKKAKRGEYVLDLAQGAIPIDGISALTNCANSNSLENIEVDEAQILEAQILENNICANFSSEILPDDNSILQPDCATTDEVTANE